MALFNQLGSSKLLKDARDLFPHLVDRLSLGCRSIDCLRTVLLSAGNKGAGRQNLSFHPSLPAGWHQGSQWSAPKLQDYWSKPSNGPIVLDGLRFWTDGVDQ